MQLDSTSLLNRILEEGLITPLFQPIYDLTSGHVYGYEALSRGPKDTELFAPDVLFPFAQAQGRLHELELLCRERAISRFVELQLPGQLFLNVSASLLSSPDHQKGMTLSILKDLGLKQHNIVIELSEKHPYDQNGLTHQSVEHYREMGFQVAIDDLGAGYSGLRLWSEVRPDIVKLDKHFIEGVHQDAIKREFVRSIINISQRLRCALVAEGIEHKEELDQLLEMGVKYGQGFFLQHPSPLPNTEPHEYLLNHVTKRMKQHAQQEETVQSLSRESVFVESTRPLSEVAKLFKENKGIFALPVVENGKPLGIIRRHALHELFSTPYGRALYENKSALAVTSTDVLIVESNVSLASVSTMFTDQDTDLVNNEILIVHEGLYFGLGHLKDLLKRITELKIQNATYSNPLTLLPGNVPINREIDRRLLSEHDFYVAYFDLNNFKPFNDYYGYAKGDAIIQLVGSILRSVVTSEENFIGHVGGDDFVVIFHDEDWCDQCHTILKRFAAEVVKFYNPNDLDEGGIWTKSRDGDHAFFDVLSLAIGVVNPNPKVCDSHHFVAELAAQAKKSAKQRGGNQIYQQPYQYHFEEDIPAELSRCCS